MVLRHSLIFLFLFFILPKPTQAQTTLNGENIKIKNLITEVSNLTGKNFIFGSDIKGSITIINDTPVSKDIAYEIFLSALEINGYTTVTTPSGLIKIIKQQDALHNPLQLYKTEAGMPVTDNFVTRIVRLKNKEAKEMIPIIKQGISSSGHVEMSPSGTLLIVTENAANIDYVMKLIGELDK